MFGLNELIYFSHFCHCMQDDNNDDTVADGVGIDVSAQTCSIMTSLHGNAFHITGPFCEEPIGHWWIPCTKAFGQDFDISYDAILNKQLNNQLWRRWIETSLH